MGGAKGPGAVLTRLEILVAQGGGYTQVVCLLQRALQVAEPEIRYLTELIDAKDFIMALNDSIFDVLRNVPCPLLLLR